MEIPAFWKLAIQLTDGEKQIIWMIAFKPYSMVSKFQLSKQILWGKHNRFKETAVVEEAG